MSTTTRIFCLLLILSYTTSMMAQEVFDSSYVKFDEQLYFDSGSHELSDTSLIKLNQLIEKTAGSDNVAYFVDAHTDDQGSEEANMILSKERKEAVCNYLATQGIADSLIVSKFHGENKLAVDNTDAYSRRLNRRVVVKTIATIKFTYLEGQIVDKDTDEGIEGSVVVKAKDYTSTTQTDNEGVFKVALPFKENVSLEYSVKDYFFELKYLKVLKPLTPVKMSLAKAKVGSKMILKDINFQPGVNVILDRSKQSLSSLFRFLTLNEESCIELAGHIHQVGPVKDPKADLSIARSLIIFKKLKEYGIDETRILIRGYGDAHRIFPNAKTAKEMETNRRVEIIMVDCDSIALLANDTLVDKRSYSNLVRDHNFNQSTMERDLEYFFGDQKILILAKLRDLKAKEIDPASYTYGELLKEGLDLKYENNELARTLRNIYDQDQKYRIEADKIEQRFSHNSKQSQKLWTKINQTDSLNLVAVKEILDNNGWLGPKKVSRKGNMALFLVIQHADLNTQLQYLSLMEKAAEEGTLQKANLAMLKDRIAMRQGKKQIYGSQILTDQETGLHYVAPILDPENVNQRRREVGLGTIEEYIKRWKLVWDKELQRMNALKE